MGNDSKYSSEQTVEEARKALLEVSREPKGIERTLRALGIITQALATRGIKPILVGGQAVEVYTFGNYTTVDVDFVLSGFEEAGQTLVELGFDPKSPGHSHWYHKELELPIEIPSNTLYGSMDKVNELDVDGMTIHVIGIEDLILDRLRAGVYWKSNSDMEWAKFLLKSYLDDLDLAYIEATARPENNVWEVCKAILIEISSDA